VALLIYAVAMTLQLAFQVITLHHNLYQVGLLDEKVKVRYSKPPKTVLAK